LGRQYLDVSLSLRRGTGAFGALRAPKEPWEEGSSRMKLRLVDQALSLLFQLTVRRLRWSTAWYSQ